VKGVYPYGVNSKYTYTFKGLVKDLTAILNKEATLALLLVRFEHSG
jgi:hypothetical protein